MEIGRWKLVDDLFFMHIALGMNTAAVVPVR